LAIAHHPDESCILTTIRLCDANEALISAALTQYSIEAKATSGGTKAAQKWFFPSQNRGVVNTILRFWGTKKTRPYPVGLRLPVSGCSASARERPPAPEVDPHRGVNDSEREVEKRACRKVESFHFPVPFSRPLPVAPRDGSLVPLITASLKDMRQQQCDGVDDRQR
jgi:hypothetical protein